MKKIYNFLGPRIALSVLFIILYAEVAGIYHTIKKHTNEEILLAVIIPPVSWYRSIELLWHKEISEVDWNNLLRNDIRLIIDLYNKTEEEQKALNLHKVYSEYSKKILAYPKDKRQKLVDACKKFNEYQSMVFEDLQTPTLKYFETGQINFKFSNRTQELEKILEQKYNLKEYIDFQKKKIIDYSLQFNSASINTLSKEEIEKVKSNYILIMKKDREENQNHFEILFKGIFNENAVNN